MAERPAATRLWPVDAAFVALLALVTLVAWWLVVCPHLAALESEAVRRAQLAGRSVEASNLQQSVLALRRQLAELQQRLAESPTRLESEGEVNRQLAMLADVAASCGLDIDQLDVGGPGTDGEYRVVPILIETRGSYTAAARFLHRLQGSMPGGAVTSFDLTGNPGRAGSEATFELNLAWYALPAPAR